MATTTLHSALGAPVAVCVPSNQSHVHMCAPRWLAPPYLPFEVYEVNSSSPSRRRLTRKLTHTEAYTGTGAYESPRQDNAVHALNGADQRRRRRNTM